MYIVFRSSLKYGLLKSLCKSKVLQAYSGPIHEIKEAKWLSSTFIILRSFREIPVTKSLFRCQPVQITILATLGSSKIRVNDVAASHKLTTVSERCDFEATCPPSFL